MLVNLKQHLKPFASLLMACALCACGGDGQTASFKGMEFDSIVVDSIASLSKSSGSPSCHISLSIQYAKGGKAEAINDTVLRSGLLVPDYLSLSNEKLTVEQAVDSFVKRYINDYLTDYGALYRADQEHAASYECAYSVKTRTSNGATDILNYIATTRMFAGGAHAITQTIVRNFNVKDGRLVRLSDLFISGYESQLQEMLVAELSEQFDVDGLEGLQSKGIFADGQVYVSDNFIYGEDDITFIYCEDEIAPHDVGEIRIAIDIDDLKRLMK